MSKETKETKETEMHLIRTNNGEYVSEEYAVFVSHIQAKLRLAEAEKYGLPLEMHILQDGSIWFFKHELKAISDHRKIDYDALERYLNNLE